ncbi:hypothetical protein HNY73_007365 [Argiope bruennichi]|uniref:SWIM-type domain-containing protein n=1 Tax=Argiope bruennichi TaxID=94029 RepID=A0A8T0FDQ6_ARGBR|nr:hypothetical protein HNY73_007365 [Argiope bruennichi]
MCECPMRCDECHVSIHMMVCACINYSIRFIICKHIHYVCEKKKNITRESETIQDQENLDNEDNLVIIENDPREKLEIEKSAIISHLQNECSKDFGCRKSKIVNQLKEVLVKAQNWDSAYPLPDVEKIKVLKACFDLSVV